MPFIFQVTEHQRVCLNTEAVLLPRPSGNQQAHELHAFHLPGHRASKSVPQHGSSPPAQTLRQPASSRASCLSSSRSQSIKECASTRKQSSCPDPQATSKLTSFMPFIFQVTEHQRVCLNTEAVLLP